MIPSLLKFPAENFLFHRGDSVASPREGNQEVAWPEPICVRSLIDSRTSVLSSMTQCLLGSTIPSPCHCGTIDPNFYCNQELFSLSLHWGQNTVLLKASKTYLCFSVAASNNCLYFQTIKKRIFLVFHRNPTFLQPWVSFVPFRNLTCLCTLNECYLEAFVVYFLTKLESMPVYGVKNPNYD